MELKNYFYPLRRWWWLIVAATLVAALSSFLVTLQQPPVYQARTTLMVGRAIEDANPSANQFFLGQQLATTYADIANREQVREMTAAAFGWDALPAYRARALPNSQMIEITVNHVDPRVAQAVANELANQLISLTPTSTDIDEKDRQTFLNAQLDTLELQIDETEAQIERLQAELGDMLSARQIEDTQNQIAALEGKLHTLTANYASLLANTQGGAVNTLTVIEPAGLPARPVGPGRMVAVMVAAVIGAVLAMGAAYLLEYLDDSIKTPQEVERIVGYPVIGYTAEVGKGNIEQPYAAKNPRHPFAEAIRSLRTNLEFAAVDGPLKSILITSAEAGDGKSSVAANLAVVMAQGEKKVVLLDADMRQPKLHEFMEMNNDSGLSDIFRGRLNLHTGLRIWKDGRVAVVTGGAPPPNPTELVGSKKMDQVLSNLEEVADTVIVDGPPFVVADAAVLAAKVDGVILVIRPGYTPKAAAQAMVEQIKRSGARVLGVVLNRIPRKLADYYQGQVYISPYYSSPYFDDTLERSGSKWQRPAEKAGASSRNGRGREGKVAPAANPTKSGNK